jgi:predicted exporter
LEIIRAAFNQIPQRANDTRLVMSGTSVLSVESRNTIQSEVKRLASISLIVVIGLLLLIYRSPLLVALGMLPVLTGAMVGMTAVSLAFGHIHGLTLAFGTTLIGESVDYSIYLFIQGAGGVNSRVFWRTIRLGVFTSIAGFAALLFSSFPGLSQLGLYSLSGLIAAALVTRYVLPNLMPAAIDSRRIVKAGAVLTIALERAKSLRWVLYFLLVIALGYIVSFDGAVWNRQLSALSPISKSAQQLDMELRGDMGGTNVRYFASFVAADEESALQGAERASRLLQPLIDARIIGGFNSPSFMLPSVASQRERQAAMPDENNLRINLHEALQGLPLKENSLQGFIADVSAARIRAPLTRADLAGTSVSALFDSLLIKRANDFLVLIPLTESGEGPHGDEIDVSKVSTALQASAQTQVQTHFTVIDLLEETTSVFDGYLHEASLLAGLGCLAIAVLLLLTSPLAQALRIMLALTCAVLCVVALLLAFGVQLNMLHLIGLLLVVAVGSNYALFFNSDAQAQDSATQSKVAVSVLIANLTAVGGFGLLGFSTVPVLSSIGSTVGIGTFLALIFSAILADSKSSTA